MKKLVMTVAVLACAASIVSAQTVTSANMVGYTKVNAVGGQLTMCALNFETGGATLQELIGTDVPNLSGLFLWDVSAGAYVTASLGSRGTWSPDLVLELGDAFWIQAAGSGTNELIFSGEVLITDSVITVPSGLAMVGYGYPVDQDWQNTQISADLPNLSGLFVWDNDTQSYTTYAKGSRGTWNGNPGLGPTEGFWVDNSGVQIDVDEPVPFTP